MNVKLISYSTPAIDMEEDIKNAQDLVAYCARVSNPSNQLNTETSSKLLHYLVQHKHWSPFEMVSACLEIETTRDIGRQLLRHRSFSFQEFSQRYANPLDDLKFTRREARLQDPSNRQNSIDIDDDDPVQNSIRQQWLSHQDKIALDAHKAYTWAIENGLAKEQARAILPEGLTLSRMYVNGTLRSWIHYIELRSAHGTQKEHIEIAKEIGKVIATIFPSALSF